MKKFKLILTEHELKALIDHYHSSHWHVKNYSTETSERIHNLTKRLNKNTPEIEVASTGGLYDDPFPKDNPQVAAAKTEPQTSW
jgi:hypothetical protein